MLTDACEPARGGMPDGLKGLDYQQNLISLYLLNLFNGGLKFKCWTEHPKARKLDDLVIKHMNGNNSKYIFLQAKHKVKAMELNYLTLFTDKKYSIQRYFESFVDIEGNFGINYNDVDTDEVIFVTNNLLPEPINETVTLVSPSLSSNVLKLNVKNHEIFKDFGAVYAFSDESENIQRLKCILLAYELAKLLFEKKPSNLHLLSHSKDFLMSEVFMLENNSIRFRPDFLVAGSDKMELFRNVFQQTIESSLFETNQKYKKTRDFWTSLKNEKLNPDLYNRIEKFNTDDFYVVQKIECFMKKFRLVTGLTNNHIENAIKYEILSQINDISFLKKTFLEFQVFVKNWFSNKNQKSNCSGIDQNKMAEFFHSTQNKLKDQNLIFSKNPDLTNFLKNSTESQILIYEVAKSETFWGLVRLHNIKKSIFHLNSESADETFETALEFLAESSESQEICMVLECVGSLDAFLSKYWERFVDQLKEKTNAKLVVICEEGSSYKEFEGYKKIVQRETTCGDILKTSLNDCLEKDINFQGKKLQLKDLIRADQLIEVPLKELEDVKEVGTEPSIPDNYIQRALYTETYLSNQILEDFTSKSFEDHLCFDEREYDQLVKNRSDNQPPVHYIQKVDDKNSKWKKSNKSLELIRKYVDLDRIDRIDENYFLTNAKPLNLIAGQAGMGKSTFFRNLAHKFKTKFPYCWVQKLDLQDHLSELNDLKNTKNPEDFEELRKYFCEKILKLDSKLKKIICRQLMENGQFILLMDAYDEICANYKDTIISIVEALMEVSKGNKIFLSTRTSWTVYLENKFLMFPFWFHRFSNTDQVEFLKTFWRKDDSWSDFIKTFLNSINAYIKSKLPYTGIPLITEVIGKYFAGKVEDENLLNDPDAQSRLTSTKYTLVELMENSTYKYCEIYCTKLTRTEENNPCFPIQMDTLLEKHEQLALYVIFPKLYHKFFSPHQTFKKDLFIKIGLVDCSNAKFLFRHDVCPDYLVAKFFKEKFNVEIVREFIFEDFLPRDGHETIRTIFNEYIGDLISEQNQSKIRSLLVKNIQVLNVAAKESNVETFNVLLDILVEEDKDVLMEKDSGEFSIFYNLFRNCEVPANFFEKLKNKFGLEFVRTILLTKNGKSNLKLMSGAAFYGVENYAPLRKWIRNKFSKDKSFIQEVLLTVEQEHNDIFRKMIKDFELEPFMALLHELKCIDDEAEQKFLKQLILYKTDGETFLQSLIKNMASQKGEEENFQTTIKLLEWIYKNTDSTTIHEVFNSKDNAHQNLICYAAKYFKTKIVEFLRKVEGWVNLGDFLGHVNGSKETFLAHLISDVESDNQVSILIEVLDYINENNRDLLNKLCYFHVLSKDFREMVWEAGEKKERLSSIVMKLVGWFRSNVPNFDEYKFFSEIYEETKSFIDILILNSSDHSDKTTEIINKLHWLEKILPDLFPRFLLDSKNLLYKVCCSYDDKSFVPNLIQQFYQCTKMPIQDFTINFLLSVNDDCCHTIFSSFIKNDKSDKAASAILSTLDWLKETDKRSLDKILCFQSKNQLNLLQQLCDDSYKFFPKVFKTLIVWLQKNVLYFKLEAFLNHRDNKENSLVYFCSKSHFKQIKNWLNEYDKDIYSKVITDKNGKIYVENKQKEKLDIFGELNPFEDRSRRALTVYK